MIFDGVLRFMGGLTSDLTCILRCMVEAGLRCQTSLESVMRRPERRWTQPPSP